MADQPLGITFRETMTGGFALGAGDPREGLVRGRREGTELSMHATVAIADLDRFIRDPSHLGGLSGSVDFPPLGQGIPGGSGAFNLFSPAGEPDLKLMIYELGFTHGGESYYLAGRKEVRDDPGLDLWRDTTTLYTRLHRGADATGPVAGAGVLALGVGDLIRLVSTMRVTGGGGAAERARALAGFGRFFLGELWDTYVHQRGENG